MRLARITYALGGVLLLASAIAQPCVGADGELQLTRHVLRPGETIGVKPATKLDASKKVFLRLTGPSEVDDLPVDPAHIGRGLLQIGLPKALRQGKYEVALVSESGEVLAKGPRLKILATETPTITKVIPQSSYAVNDTYSFELVGENFGQEPEDNVLTINDTPMKFTTYVPNRDRRRSLQDCQGKLPCLVGNRRSLKVYGLSLANEAFHRPLQVSVRVDSQVSADHLLLLSWAQRSTPIVVAFAVLAALSAVTYLMIRGKAAGYRPVGRRYSTLAYVFIDPETNTYSLSRLQLLAWTAAAVVAYVYVGASECLVQWQWVLPKVPDGLAPLMGVSLGTTALAAGATEARGSKGSGPAHPGLGDFLTAGGALAPERLQFFVWTILGVVGFLSATLVQDPSTVSEAAKIPDNFLPLMGVSSLGYLAGKVIRKPGPIIRQLAPAPPYAPGAPLQEGIRIVGDNLSPRALVWVNRRLIPSGSVTVPPARSGAAEQSAAMEFVNELLVDPAAAAAALAPLPAVAPAEPGAAPVPPDPAPAVPAPAPAPVPAPPAAAPGGVGLIRVVNPDGQSAEI